MQLTDEFSNLSQLKAAFFQLFEPSVSPSEIASQFYWWAAERLGLSQKDFILYPEQDLASANKNQIHRDFEALKKGTPLQYVLGRVNFLGLDLMVGPGVLIPRPETEEMVQHIMDAGPFQQILDVGTGSGCIALKLKQHFPNAEVTALDISTDALQIANKNAQYHHLKMDFKSIDFCDATQWPHLPKVDLLVSNPPYIPISEVHQMEKNVTDFEPHIALFVPDQDPLVFYRNLLDFAVTHLQVGGQIWAEIHFAQASALKNLAAQYPFHSFDIIADFFGKPRFLHIKN